MRNVYPIITNNPLKSKSDLALAVKQLCDPLKPFFSENGAFLDLGNTFSRCNEKTAMMEAFARPLWGLAPLLAGGGDWDNWDVYLKGIRSGTDPENDEYWGDIGDCDQKMVELATIALTLLIAPDKSWERLSQKEKENLASWIGQTNKRETVDTNWLFFRVLVNIALLKVGVEWDVDMLEHDLNRLDEFYLSSGWYKDGDTEQMDYYIPFAFHFYSLIYAKVMENDDLERSKIFKERATLFAKDFIYWFAENGSALAFGRSLTYRFAQSCFWGGLAFAGVEALPFGVIKGLLLRNLRWWFNQYIFTPDGLLTIGYAYPNLIMAEGYNAPGSPYWAMKSFLPLALSEDHPFWKAEELPMPLLKRKSVQKEARMILCREFTGKNVFAFTSGQHAAFEPAHCAAKYGKFVYSNTFGFSVSKGNYGLEQGAYDNNLALAEKDNLYRTRRRCEEFTIEENVIYSLWKPWNDVEICSWIIPGLPWHVRIHKITTNRELDIAEGGFAIPNELNRVPYKDNQVIYSQGAAAALLNWGCAGIKCLLGDLKGEIIHTEPNTNLVHPLTIIPTLTGAIGKGINWIASAVFVKTEALDSIKAYEKPPILEIHDNIIIIIDGENGKKLIELKME
ncbi:DUF2264 domain-containing protein [Clostridium bowmanii]|uniref:DUF2264 domain-containing protein n=1 Tax=Clostridium bowmanii TaxID=132925 RepID=UPI001C0D55D3|nr:DUF2264 domain-containing protein [Clostridium bowmanii]MBU3191001.1 DUF2264 domain-containing protein [Clostridium bowmanii]MCA1075323.1 DUF2264 domain-containing protein [Clostridium bowmanii]